MTCQHHEFLNCCYSLITDTQAFTSRRRSRSLNTLTEAHHQIRKKKGEDAFLQPADLGVFRETERTRKTKQCRSPSLDPTTLTVDLHAQYGLRKLTGKTRWAIQKKQRVAPQTHVHLQQHVVSRAFPASIAGLASKAMVGAPVPEHPVATVKAFTLLSYVFVRL